ncbi:hypothetical protein Peur_030337 [Populus x canadensis]
MDAKKFVHFAPNCPRILIMAGVGDGQMGRTLSIWQGTILRTKSGTRSNGQMGRTKSGSVTSRPDEPQTSVPSQSHLTNQNIALVFSAHSMIYIFYHVRQ